MQPHHEHLDKLSEEEQKRPQEAPKGHAAKRDEQEQEQRGEQQNRKKEEKAKQDKQRAREQQEMQLRIQANTERCGSILGAMHRILHPHEVFTADEKMSIADRKALEKLNQAKEGKDHLGQLMSGAARNKLFNQAIAALQPILHLARQPQLLDLFHEQYQEVEEGTLELRDEIKQNIYVEAHKGRTAREHPVDDAEKDISGVKLSELGSLSWELAQLGRKKRRRFEDDETPIELAPVLDAMSRYAELLGTLAARYAMLEGRISKTKPALYKRIAILRKHHRRARFELIQSVGRFLRDCGETDHMLLPGTYPELREQFAPLVDEYSGVDTFEQALPAARKIIETIDACIAVASGEDPPKGGGEKRGLLRGLFGRRKK